MSTLNEPLVSVVIPTLNEGGTIGECIGRVITAYKIMGIDGEIIIADNSTDNTPNIAQSLGAKVVTPKKMGYGNAYREGFKHARGKYVVILDGDLTYDPLEIPKFIKLLEDGKADFVMGTRLKGDIKKGAMPPLHRYIGNPVLTWLLNVLFKAGISDSHCGMRAITRDALGELDLQTSGMEFASEMVIEAPRKGLKIAEVPISYYPRKGVSKLSSFSDGWRHLRFMMLYRPVPFLNIPGIIALLLGLALIIFIQIHGSSNDIRMHSFILGSFLILIGYHTLLSGLYIDAFGKTYGVSEKVGYIKRLMNYHSLERELIIGSALLLAGVILGISVILDWWMVGYGSIQEVQKAIMAMVLSMLGIETIFSSIIISLLLLNRD